MTNARQSQTAESLKHDLSQLSSKLKESEYNCLMINKRLEKEQKMGEEGKLKTKATLQGMRSALVAVEEAVRERAIGAKQHMKDLELLHESFGRHLKHGYSSSPSYVAFNLLEKMGSSLAGLKNSVEKCDEGVNNVAVRNAAEVSATMFNSSGKNGETITDTIADICSELERENARLKRELEAANDKIAAGKMDVDNAMKLLPEYRLEIVRARSGMEGVGRELKCEKEANVHLQRRLDECVIALRGAEEARVLGMGVGVFVGGGGPKISDWEPTIEAAGGAGGAGGTGGTGRAGEAPTHTNLKNETILFENLLRSSLGDLKRELRDELNDAVKFQTEAIMGGR